MKKFLFILSVIVFTVKVAAESGNGSAGNPFYGTISTVVQWSTGNPDYGSTVYVGTSGNPDLTIATGGHLTIDPGITVIFTQLTSDLIITGSGLLTTEGNSSNSIIFTKASANGHWGHITFEIPGSTTPITGSGSFKYCKVEHGYANGAFPNPNSAGGGIQINAPNVTIENCYFDNNYATFGGAVTVNANQNTTIKNCYFKSNSAYECAGALLLYLGTASVVENCIFESNYCAGTTQVFYGGGAIWVRQSTSKIVNCTFVNNTSPRAGDAVYSYSSSTAKIINSIFWGSSDQFATTGTAAVISNCAFETTKPASSVNSIIINSSNSAPDGPNFTATDGTNWSIKYVSPCRDAGVDSYTGVSIPLLDYAGNSRVRTTDMGAYEVQYSRWKTTASSTDWTTAANWDGGVPTSTRDVIVPTGATNYPTGSTTQDFTLGAGKLMIIEQGARVTLDDLTNNGTLKLNATSAGFASLIINSYTKGGGATEEIQLFLTGGGTKIPLTYKWHYISSPVTSLNVGTFAPTYTLNVAQWVESRPASSLSQGWVAYDGYIYSTGGMGGPTFSTLNPGKGYDYFKTTDYTYIFGGQLNTGDVTTNLDYTSGNDNLYGYNLIGNPFSSGLDWDYIITHSFPAKTTKSLYFTKNSTLCTYINGVGVPGDVNGIIPPMQGFFSKTYSTGNTIVFAAAARTHNNIHSRYKGSESIIPLIRLALTDDTLSDETVVRFDDLAKSDLDYDFDAVKMFLDPDLSTIYSSLSGTDYAINGIPFPETFVEIPITVNIATDAITKTITASQLQGLDNYDVTLTDNTTGFTADVKTTPSVTFAAAKGTIAGRFILKVSFIMTGVENTTVSRNKFNIYQANNQINIQTLANEWEEKSGSVRVVDLTGRSVTDLQNIEFRKNSVTQILAPGAKGLYVVEIRSGSMRYVGKVVIR